MTRKTSIASDACVAFTNHDGNLECDNKARNPQCARRSRCSRASNHTRTQPVNDEGLPPGSYLGSCGGCHMNDDATLLQCSLCINGAGEYVSAEADLLACNAFANNDGKLECDPAIGRQEL
eukprot:TRINITY_DN7678_c0_g1_i1.p2 TRINITY_DN7678_c0_g1~~TRINITY_DN7678_c0_g1_i1.p2  ORF type:complete len:121 (-),score=31.81 TRINITY_DN7678_c0_g1_i1:206-568(-)